MILMHRITNLETYQTYKAAHMDAVANSFNLSIYEFEHDESSRLNNWSFLGIFHICMAFPLYEFEHDRSTHVTDWSFLDIFHIWMAFLLHEFEDEPSS